MTCPARQLRGVVFNAWSSIQYVYQSEHSHYVHSILVALVYTHTSTLSLFIDKDYAWRMSLVRDFVRSLGLELDVKGAKRSAKLYGIVASAAANTVSYGDLSIRIQNGSNR